MNEINDLPTVEILKSQARRLRDRLSGEGHVIGHSQALEILAHQMAYKDWNTLHAAAGNRYKKRFLDVGERVSGMYLGQPFQGEILGVTRQHSEDRYRVVIHFDEPVDVVAFDSFSAFRQRVSCTLNADYKTAEKTGNGSPQLILNR
jgi:mRNA-degrading endonuclease RelE of RelBE toxin-antitoxin system